ncbi:hypothetical protein Pan44_53310 [Caulifigura coniformis]|uniref:DUF4393 domain-containing protein n=1 Tax=Caulifigura coniformis TaxID=2527983 RepID=A0A517SMB1_9PLAN|nr:Abi-alpha family protein [Caulifigura coniformis]QDT57263.1 hypothetical protein Pan44_53310 [Caulifigura coniformis]
MSDELKAAAIQVADKAYDESRPAIEPLVQTFANVFKMTAFVTGLPAATIGSLPSAYAASLRAFQKLRDAIPEPNRQPPKESIVYSLVQTIPAADEATEAQELFAQLLASASDDRSVSRVHPSFASIIAELSPVDARIIATWKRCSDNVRRSPIDFYHLGRQQPAGDVSVSLENLSRLGLLYSEVDLSMSPPKWVITRFGRQFVDCCCPPQTEGG